ncbi:MAG: phosphoribosylamine--glycine ligase [Euryarchaeota archaeon]|nr:phosphoribosylamine--glycine ligase [Euryarchaeota archaeon]
MAEATVLVVGGGGREHALTMGLVASPSVGEVHVAPGNAGTSLVATNHPFSADDVDALVGLAQSLECDLVIVGPEGPLVDGLADRLRLAGIPCFGPHEAGAQLEGSKLYAKQTMQDLNIPTAGIHLIKSESQIADALNDFSPPWVVKRDVLAGGKGVVVTSDRNEAETTLLEGVKTDGFVLLEEFLSGEEASMLIMLDESGWVALPASQDHKRVGEGDTGPNTGGMGAYAPAPVVTDVVRQKVYSQIVEPMHKWLSSQEIPYRGCLYVGLMIDESDDPYVVEYNVRFGDPETQVTIPLISSDLYELLFSVATGQVATHTPIFSDASALTVVLAAEGYPNSPRKGLPISIETAMIANEDGGAFIHHAGTRYDVDGELVSSGGRVLASTGIAPSLDEARNLAYSLMDGIILEGSHFRGDIGFRAL